MGENVGSGESSSVLYALQDWDSLDALQPGRNVIGRNAADADGVPVIGVTSSRGAVSRVQATIDVAPNGDVWISDCGSTNGTYLSVRQGTGIRLEPSRYYQLLVGSIIRFGDAARRLVTVNEKGVVLFRQTEPPDEPRSTEPTPTKARSTGRDTAAAAASRASSQAAAAAALRDVPYLDDLKPPTRVSGMKRGSAEPSQASARPAKSSRASHSTEAASPPSQKKKKKDKPADETANDDVFCPVVVCTSGMKPEDKTKAKKALKAHGGHFTEDITKATLLVVGSPAVRTPKFIIAVARRVPIVPLACLEEAAPLRREVVGRHIVPLKDNGRTYTAAALRSAILRQSRPLLLEDLVFNLAALKSKAKQVASDVITGCGGTTSTARKTDKEAIPIESQKNLEDLYDQILRGKRPGQL